MPVPRLCSNHAFTVQIEIFKSRSKSRKKNKKKYPQKHPSWRRSPATGNTVLIVGFVRYRTGTVSKTARWTSVVRYEYWSPVLTVRPYPDTIRKMYVLSLIHLLIIADGGVVLITLSNVEALSAYSYHQDCIIT